MDESVSYGQNVQDEINIGVVEWYSRKHKEIALHVNILRRYGL
jgi:hypothetical protein